MSDKKIVLINPFCEPSLSSGYLKDFLVPMPPIGIAYIMSSLQHAGHTVVFHDDFVAHGDNARLRAVLDRERPDIVGISVLSSPVVYRFQEISRMVREVLPESLLIAGNIHASVFYRSILEERRADIVIFNEGEDAFCEVVHGVRTGGDLSSVPGIAFFRDGEVHCTAARAYANDLDRLPFPAWQYMPMRSYDYFLFEKISRKQVFFLTSRGCTSHCHFCSLKNVQGQGRRTRSLDNIFREIEWLYADMGVRALNIKDPMFPATKKEGLLFCSEMIRRGWHRKLIWMTQTRTDMVDEELLRKMFAAGCRKILFGIEAGSAEALDVIHKPIDRERTRRAVTLCRKAGIVPVGLFMLGSPGETEEQIRETISFACSLDLVQAKFAVFVPYPGTVLYAQGVTSGDLLEPHLERWECYTTDPTERTPSLYRDPAVPVPRIVALQAEAYRRFYLRPRTILSNVPFLFVMGLRPLWQTVLYLFRSSVASLMRTSAYSQAPYSTDTAASASSFQFLSSQQDHYEQPDHN